MNRRLIKKANLMLQIKSFWFTSVKRFNKCIHIFFKGVGIVFVQHPASLISTVLGNHVLKMYFSAVTG